MALYVGNEYVEELDPCYPSTFTYDNKVWSSAEHLYQALKFADKTYYNYINSLTDLNEIIIAGNNSKYKTIFSLSSNSLQTDDKREELMYISQYHKITQNKHIKDILVYSGDEDIIYIVEGEYCKDLNNKWLYWGYNYSIKIGQNIHGKILKRIRAEL
jgi:predicted NAD-dependent protein-ADP-ribosyltransferase YbiA (DUF1768 family)